MSKTILISSGYSGHFCLSPTFAKNASSYPINHETHIYVLRIMYILCNVCVRYVKHITLRVFMNLVQIIIYSFDKYC